MNWSFAFDSLPVRHFWLQMELKFLSQPRQAVGHIFPAHPRCHFLVRLLLKPGPALRSICAVKHAWAIAFHNRTSLEALPSGVEIPGLQGRKQRGENVL